MSNGTPELVLTYRRMGRTLTHQVGMEKIRDLRHGNLFMTLPNNPHFAYVRKFLAPVLLIPEDGTLGIVCLSVPMGNGDGCFRTVFYFRIQNVKLAESGEDWLFSLGGEVK
jgi:hypothetical protein